MQNHMRLEHSMELNLNELIQENLSLKEQLEQTEKQLASIKHQYASLEEDFIHALQCEHKAICPKANLSNNASQPVTISKVAKGKADE